MQTIDRTTEILFSLLRGELSAVETYSQAIHKFPESPSVGGLEGIRADHLDSVHVLRGLIQARGEHPPTDSGVWGGFAKAVEGVAAMFGDSSARAALLQGEKHGINDYEAVLADDHVAPEVKTPIREKLLPALRRHLITLESLIS